MLILTLILAVLAHEYFPKFTEKIITVTPLVGVILTTLLCASPVSWLSQLTVWKPREYWRKAIFIIFIVFLDQIGQVADVLKTQGTQLIAPVALLHAAAFGLGYGVSKLSNFGESTSRTISIECGMQVLWIVFKLFGFFWPDSNLFGLYDFNRLLVYEKFTINDWLLSIVEERTVLYLFIRYTLWECVKNKEFE